MNSSPYLASLFLFAISSPPVDAARQVLSAHSDRMFFWLVISSAVTGIGVIFEAPGELHELGRWWKLRKLGMRGGWKIPVTFFGLLLVIGGIIGEGIFEFLSSNAETAIRAHDEQVLADTIIKAGTAKDSADAAAANAKLAQDASGDAVGKADAAVSSATQATISARKAVREADSFEAEIVSAKKGAADAISRLADAQQRLAEATQKTAEATARVVRSEMEVSRIRSPRSLEKRNEFISVLKPFRGTEYRLSVFLDEESNAFLRVIDAALIDAGWVRKQPASMNIGIPTMKLRLAGRRQRGIRALVHFDGRKFACAI